MENTRTLLCFLSIDNSEGSESREKGGQATNGKYILAERKEKQSRLGMCVVIEYVQKKMHAHTQHLSSYILFS
jgi:hypothetical protein